MSKCGKGCMPECEYFTTGGCISPFNCMYKEESGYINSATSGSIIYTGRMNMTNEEMIENLKCVIADISAQCKQLETENASLRARLEKAVELKEPDIELNPYTGDWELRYQEVVTKVKVYDEREEAEARLAELKAKK